MVTVTRWGYRLLHTQNLGVHQQQENLYANHVSLPVLGRKSHDHKCARRELKGWDESLGVRANCLLPRQLYFICDKSQKVAVQNPKMATVRREQPDEHEESSRQLRSA